MPEDETTNSDEQEPAAEEAAAPVEAPPGDIPEVEAPPGDVPQGDAPAEGDAPAAPVPAAALEVGALADGTVQRITPYGAFVQLPGGKLGLIHISEIDRNYVKDVRDHLREGDAVQAKILAIKEDGKIDLSIKAMQDPQPRIDRRRGADPEFEQMLRKFMRQSEERQVDVKRSVMHKRK